MKKLLCRVKSAVCLGGSMKREDRQLIKNQDDENDTRPSKVDPIPLQSKELVRNDEKVTRPSKFDLIPLQSKELVRNNEKDTRPSKFDPIPLQSKELVRIDEKDTRPSTFDPIPLDLEVDILTRLPAKSLMKFQDVSKMWSSIIRSQRFVDSYYALSSVTQPDRFIITFVTSTMIADMCRLLVFSSSYGCEKSSSLATNLDMTIPSEAFFTRVSYCASVRGLLGYTTSGSYIVCNPSTNNYTILPCPAPRTYLGYDPVGHQFKALVTMLSYDPPHHVAHEVLTLGGGESSWTRNYITTPPYFTCTRPLCMDGFVYFGAWTPDRSENPVIVCFDVRHETISFIHAPRSVVAWECESILIEYKGKLASIVRGSPYASFDSFDLYILEDVEKHDWSVQSFELPFSLGRGKDMTCPGTNKAGEIIFAPLCLPRDVEPFYIFYYNVERNDMRRVRLLGIADDEEFRRRYRIPGQCFVCISPQHVQSIASI